MLTVEGDSNAKPGLTGVHAQLGLRNVVYRLVMIHIVTFLLARPTLAAD